MLQSYFIPIDIHAFKKRTSSNDSNALSLIPESDETSNCVVINRSGSEISPLLTDGAYSSPRCLAEANVSSDSSKYRQLPCRTFISVGTCPYRERCVYLHDPRCMTKDAKTKTRRKNKEDLILDSLFWPALPYAIVAQRLDHTGHPQVIQQYSVPTPENNLFRRHDEATYSMWMHFVDFCVATASSPTSTCPSSGVLGLGHSDSSLCYCAPNEQDNGYTLKTRLNVFQTLASGLALCALVSSVAQLAAAVIVTSSALSSTTVISEPAHSQHSQHLHESSCYDDDEVDQNKADVVRSSITGSGDCGVSDKSAAHALRVSDHCTSDEEDEEAESEFMARKHLQRESVWRPTSSCVSESTGAAEGASAGLVWIQVTSESSSSSSCASSPVATRPSSARVATDSLSLSVSAAAACQVGSPNTVTHSCWSPLSSSVRAAVDFTDTVTAAETGKRLRGPAKGGVNPHAAPWAGAAASATASVGSVSRAHCHHSMSMSYRAAASCGSYPCSQSAAALSFPLLSSTPTPISLTGTTPLSPWSFHAQVPHHQQQQQDILAMEIAQCRQRMRSLEMLQQQQQQYQCLYTAMH